MLEICSRLLIIHCANMLYHSECENCQSCCRSLHAGILPLSLLLLSFLLSSYLPFPPPYCPSPSVPPSLLPCDVLNLVRVNSSSVAGTQEELSRRPRLSCLPPIFMGNRAPACIIGCSLALVRCHGLIYISTLLVFHIATCIQYRSKLVKCCWHILE